MNRWQRILVISSLWLLALMFHGWCCDYGRGKGTLLIQSMGLTLRSPGLTAVEGFILGIAAPFSLTSLGLFIVLGGVGHRRRSQNP